MLLDNPFISDNRVEKEINSLLEYGFSVDLICEKSNNRPIKEENGKLRVFRKLENSYKKPFSKDCKIHTTEIVNFILTLNSKIIHCHDYLMLNIGRQVKRSNPSIKLVYDSHEYLKGWPIYKEANSILNRIKGFIVWKRNKNEEKKGIKNTDQIFTVSKGISEHLKQAHKLKKPPIIIRNFPQKIKLKPSNNYLREKYELDDEVKIIVHLGNIYMSDKSVKRLINYIKNEKDLVLIFIGNNFRFLSLEKTYKKSKNIYFHEYLNQKKNIEIMSSGDIGLCYVNLTYEAHYLGLVNRYMEYSYSGLAIFSSSQKEIEKLNQEIGNTIFFKKDTKSIIQCFENITEKDIFLLKTNSKEKALNYTWENESEKLINYYSNI